MSHSASTSTGGGSNSMDAAASLLFLVEMFPAQNREQLQHLLVQHDGNLDDAVQTCLTVEAAGAAGGDAAGSSSAPAAEAMVSLIPASQGEAAEEPMDEGDGTETTAADSTDDQQEEGVDSPSSDGDEVEVLEMPPPRRPASPLRASVAHLNELLTAAPAVPAAAFTASLRALLHCVTNVLEHPSVDKFRLLPYSHAKFRARIGAGDERLLSRAKALLLRVGFSDIAVPSEGGGAGAAASSSSAAASPSHEDGFLLMTDEQRDVPTLQHAKALLEHELEAVQSAAAAVAPPLASLRLAPAAASGAVPAASAAAAASSAQRPAPVLPIAHPVAAAPAPLPRVSDSLLYTPLSTLKKQFKRKSSAAAAPAKTLKLTRDQMAAKVAQRLGGKPASASAVPVDGGAPVPAAAPVAAPAGAPPAVQRAGRIMDLSHTAALRAQIDSVRRAKHGRWVAQAQGRKRVFTVEDLAAMEEADIKARAVFGSAGAAAAAAGGGAQSASKFRTLADIAVGSPADCLAAGKEMLRLTNEFRAREGKCPLQWHQSLHDIGLVHSQRMAMKLVPFGHDGARERFAAYPFRSSSAAENVAWSSGMPFADLARTHVQGWIDSPGHRKNMLAHHNWCAIAIFKNPQGAYYSTQLFGLG